MSRVDPNGKSGTTGQNPPDIYAYHDYRRFIKDWFDYRRASESRLSLRQLAKKSGVGVGHLSMFLGGQRGLSEEALVRLARALKLGRKERSHLELLRTVAETDSQELRMEAMEKIQRLHSYRDRNPREIEVYRYLTRWYYVAIREMAAVKGFRADPKWIQERLRFRIPLRDIEQALGFLVQNGYIELLPDGTARPPEKDIDCVGGVYKVAIGQFHREMLSLLSSSIEQIPSGERNVTGHCMAVSTEDYPELVKILGDALNRVAALGHKRNKSDSVYHVVFGAIPLMKKPGGGSSDETP